MCNERWALYAVKKPIVSIINVQVNVLVLGIAQIFTII